MMQKKDIYNYNSNVKLGLLILIMSIFLICTSGCGRKADPLRPGEEKVAK